LQLKRSQRYLHACVCFVVYIPTSRLYTHTHTHTHTHSYTPYIYMYTYIGRRTRGETGAAHLNSRDSPTENSYMVSGFYGRCVLLYYTRHTSCFTTHDTHYVISHTNKNFYMIQDSMGRIKLNKAKLRKTSCYTHFILPHSIFACL
jgi:hypothetical protein